jgi:hypothetical protein
MKNTNKTIFMSITSNGSTFVNGHPKKENQKEKDRLHI